MQLGNGYVRLNIAGIYSLPLGYINSIIHARHGEHAEASFSQLALRQERFSVPLVSN
jgi:hypothetical protein